ncbi:hypothetical protein AcV7_003989 [Taiwanofungus camphoratus]|nr:hypothetical protein AcV7_003989 [Antrodia cinnamomea]
MRDIIAPAHHAEGESWMAPSINANWMWHLMCPQWCKLCLKLIEALRLKVQVICTHYIDYCHFVLCKPSHWYYKLTIFQFSKFFDIKVVMSSG